MLEERLQKEFEMFIDQPHKVFDIFKDYFDEENVDIQGGPTIDEFKRQLTTVPIGTIITRSNILGSSMYNALPQLSKDIILNLLNDDVLATCLDDDEAKINYILPFMIEALKSRCPYDIIVHFPEVTVTNEKDKSVDIKDLWIKVVVSCEGKIRGTFGVNRSHYPVTHIMSNYQHSHTPGINKDNFKRFQSPCLGSGPIMSTIVTLQIGYDEAIWKLFCLELDRYVRIESIAGVPYRHLEDISVCSKSLAQLHTSTYDSLMDRSQFDNFIASIGGGLMMKDFLTYALESNKIKFNFNGSSFGLAFDFPEGILVLSNLFIGWYNRKFNEGGVSTTLRTLITRKFIHPVYYLDGKFLVDTEHTREIADYSGREVLTFKGRDILLVVENDANVAEDNDPLIHILAIPIVQWIYSRMIQILDISYGRDKERTETGAFAPVSYL